MSFELEPSGEKMHLCENAFTAELEEETNTGTSYMLRSERSIRLMQKGT
jgi:hypothetical protein